MALEQWLVKWKRNRNHQGEETVFSQRKAFELAEEKRSLGFKVEIKKLPRNHRFQTQAR